MTYICTLEPRPEPMTEAEKRERRRSEGPYVNKGRRWVARTPDGRTAEARTRRGAILALGERPSRPNHRALGRRKRQRP